MHLLEVIECLDIWFGSVPGGLFDHYHAYPSSGIQMPFICQLKKKLFLAVYPFAVGILNPA